MAQIGKRLYLDWNATAPLDEAAREAAIAALCAGGNASSVHAEGRASRALIEGARRRLAARLGVAPDGVTFTSGGTEANTMVLSPGVRRGEEAPVERLITSAVEHPAVQSGGRFPAEDVTVLPVDRHGKIALDALERALAADPRPALVSLMTANNETGVIEPLQDAAAIASRHGALVHTDAVQGFGRMADTHFEVADLVTISGHKIGAPIGVGALVRRGDIRVPALVRGGGQERGARGGTENVAAIAGFAAALDGPAADPAAWVETEKARDLFEARLFKAFQNAHIFGKEVSRLPNTSLFAIGTTPAELALIGLDLAGISVSSGSACSSGKVSVSHVLLAMGVEADIARRAIRMSAGPLGADAALERFLVALQQVIVPMEA
ncbi:aminotransferase class V-fold PLP-dependent enzyme [Acuticoccus sp. M5D2P5]|uniref:cysteine desulfurase family protein n=1 Tax=Acuticoccus kalidii TaxID=2910977 RepID=UPI001F37E842|nr:aminotransferase class V-fold PLP-dependent enzyme [Acuticoccus kalidii]